MDENKLAESLVGLAKNLIADGEVDVVDESDNKSDLRKVLMGINQLAGKFSPTSEAGIFLGIVRDMAVHIRRGNGSRVRALAKEIIEEFSV